LRVGIYTRISTQEQQTLPLQLDALRKYAKARKWKIVFEVQDIGSGIKERQKREDLMHAARQREIDAILVWKLDRWGRSLHDLIATLNELSELEVGFVSLTEAVDLTTSIGRAMAGVLAVFAQFERDMLGERVRAGIAQARKRGGQHGRPRTASRHEAKIKRLFSQGHSKAEIARKLNIGRTSVIRILSNDNRIAK
jgi:DNA invertase Pin-like site-specific DNA recombinase